MDEARLRAKYTSREDGSCCVRTLAPLGYAIPMDGPVGDLIARTEISHFRPAHLHFLIEVPGYPFWMSWCGATVPGMNSNLDALIAEATVDCHNDDEQLTGLFTMLDENVVVPFVTTVLGVPVTVENMLLTADGRIVASCVRDGAEQWISLLDLPLPDPTPDGAEWVEAYRRWAGAAGR